MSAGAALADAALGAGPGRHPLPPASDPQQLWWRGVALGGQGRFAAARTALLQLDADGVDPVLRSLALSAHASHLRQLGGHGAARPLDARALVLAAGPVRESAVRLGRESAVRLGRESAVRLGRESAVTARADALVGLAADALGPGRTALAGRLLTQAGPGGGRDGVRWCWVAAETALCGDDPDRAVVHAREGVVRAADTGSRRHVVKSALVLAAALGRDGGAERAVEVSTQARAHGLLPLEWAAAMLLAALSAAGEQARWGQRAAELASVLAVRSGSG